MPATKQISGRIPVEVMEGVEAKGALATYIIGAVREKLRRDDETEMADGFALLVASPEMWDMHFPTGGQHVANEMMNEEISLYSEDLAKVNSSLKNSLGLTKRNVSPHATGHPECNWIENEL
jgi:hypothetical protein